MGDRIAILRQGSRIAQYDTPERILTAPADEFVEDFIGSGASIKRLSLSRVRDIKTADWPVARLNDDHSTAREKMKSSGKDYVLLLDDRGVPKRWVNLEDIENDAIPLREVGWPAVAIVEENASLYNTLDIMITSYKGSAIVVDENGVYKGVVDFEAVLEAIDTMRLPDQGPGDEPGSPEPAEQGR